MLAGDDLADAKLGEGDDLWLPGDNLDNVVATLFWMSIA
jgi:hypothetical protein